MKYLNPELRLERLDKVKKDATLCTSESTSEEQFEESIQKIKQIKTQKEASTLSNGSW